MKVVKDFRSESIWGVIPYIHESFEKLSNEESDIVFMNGFQFVENPKAREPYKDYKRRCALAAWSPCEFTAFTSDHHLKDYEFFTEVYCVCPFTCNFMNEIFGHEKFKYIPYPFSNYSVSEFYNYDSVCSWFGSIHGQDHISAIETISKFPDYKFLTSQLNTWMRHPYEFNKCTHVNIPTEQKLIEVSKCKSSLTFNKLYKSPSWVHNSKFDNITHHAFDYWDNKIMPQFKVRTQEIASCKTLMLCYKDEWDLVEDFYEPGVDFVYFKTFQELEWLLGDIDNNFDKYTEIIENAYNKVQEYSVEKIFNYIKTNDESLVTWKNKFSNV